MEQSKWVRRLTLVYRAVQAIHRQAKTFIRNHRWLVAAVVMLGSFSCLGTLAFVYLSIRPPQANTWIGHVKIEMAAAESIDYSELTSQMDSDNNWQLLDDFNSLHWAAEPIAPGPPIQLTFSHSSRQNNGQTLTLQLPVSDLEHGARIGLARPLVQAEDWSSFAYLSVDISFDQQLTKLPTVTLQLTNSSGHSERLLPGNGPLRAGENPQTVFLFNHLDPDFLVHIVDISFEIIEFGDTGVTEPAYKLGIAIDNIMLDGLIWDPLQANLTTRETVGPVTESLDIGYHDNMPAESKGLLIKWQDARAREVGAKLTIPAESANWREVNYIRARLQISDPAIPVSLRLWDGQQTITIAAQLAVRAEQAETLTWELPQLALAEFDYSNIVTLEILANEVDLFANGYLLIDEISLGSSLDLAYDLQVRVGPHSNRLTWRQPEAAELDRTFIIANTSGYPAHIDDGEEVCLLAATSTATVSCVHEGVRDGAVYYYTAFSSDGEQYHFGSPTSQTIGSRDIIRFSPEGSNYEVGFSPQNGAILFIENKQNNAIFSQGNNEQNLWALQFSGTNPATTIYSSQFTLGSQAWRFSYTENPLQFSYLHLGETGELRLTVTVAEVDADGVQLFADIYNSMPDPIQGVSLPYQLQFPLESFEQALLPLEQGLLLHEPFFIEGRSIELYRPALFADIAGIEATTGNWGGYLLQNDSYWLSSEADAAEINDSLSSLEMGSSPAGGYLQFNQYAYVVPEQNWRTNNVRLRFNYDFTQLARSYAFDNGLNNLNTLRQKLGDELIFQEMAQTLQQSQYDDPAAVRANQTNLDSSLDLANFAISDRIAPFALSFSGSSQLGFASGRYIALGEEWVHWTHFPVAALMLHEQVVFYPGNHPTSIWPGNLARYLSENLLNGYSFAVNSDNLPEGWLTIISRVQEQVASRTFGQRLIQFSGPTAVNQLSYSSWGDGRNDIEIFANFNDHVIEQAGFGLAADGFLALSDEGDLVAGIFSGEFNGAPLETGGTHWITVVRSGNVLMVQQVVGESSLLRLDRPVEWIKDADITMTQLLSDGTEIIVNPVRLTQNNMTIDYQQRIYRNGAFVVGYKIYHQYDSTLQPMRLSAAEFELSLLDRAAPPEADSDNNDPDSFPLDEE